MYLAELGQLDVDSGAQPRAQVGGTGQHVPETLVPHELPAPLLDQPFHLGWPDRHKTERAVYASVLF